MAKKTVNRIWNLILQPLPDGLALRIIYRRKLGLGLHLNPPKTFTEKIQWLKLNYRRPILHQLADKYAVRDFVARKIGPEVLCEIYGVWDRPEVIPFDDLPETFALKVTSGTHANVFCRNKAKFDREGAKAALRRMMAMDFYKSTREWAYRGIEPRILGEKLLVDGTGPSPADYKFYCFDGKPEFMEVAIGRHEDRKLVKKMTINMLDVDWKPLPFRYYNYPPREEPIAAPSNLAEMIEYARQLSEGFPFSRIDFYSIYGKTVFGEITFYPGSGMAPFQPIEWDAKIGEMLRLPAVTIP